MGKFYNKFLGKNIDLAPLGIERRDDNSPYFCTPKGATIIGWAGVDGIHYCFIRGFGETVFAVSPMEIAPNYVHPLAGSFEDFLRLLLASRDANILEQAWQWSSNAFYQALEGSMSDQSVYDTLAEIQQSLHLMPMEKPWEYMKQLQDSFDYSKIKYTEEFYAPDMNGNVQPEEWTVDYGGSLYGPSDQGKAGVEIPIKKEFQYADRAFLVPAVYSCAKGLVVDFCMRVDVKDYQRFTAFWYAHFEGRDGEDLNHRDRLLLELKNPLQFVFDPEVTVNGKVLQRHSGSGFCYVPGEDYDPEVHAVLNHYRLDPNSAWSFTRACFPWKSGRRPEINSLELTMAQEPVRVPGDVFEVTGPGDQIDLNIPGHSFTLTVKDYEPQVLDTSTLSPENMEYPACYTMMTYSLSTKPKTAKLFIQDLSECDQPRKKESEPSGIGNCEAAAIAIIGGADGPTAICIGAPETEQEFAACSSPHFEPAARIRWYPVFCGAEEEPLQITLI